MDFLLHAPSTLTEWVVYGVVVATVWIIWGIYQRLGEVIELLEAIRENTRDRDA